MRENGGPDHVRSSDGDYGDIEVLVPTTHRVEDGMVTFSFESKNGFSLFALGARPAPPRAGGGIGPPRPNPCTYPPGSAAL